MDDDLAVDDVESSSFEDGLDDSEESINTDTDHSSFIKQYWQGWEERDKNDYKSVYQSCSVRSIPKLVTLAAKVAAKNLNLDQLDYYYNYSKFREEKAQLDSEFAGDSYDLFLATLEAGRKRIPDEILIPILKFSFPENDSNIRLYACLANGSSNSFKAAEHAFMLHMVSDVIQIGYMISAQVTLTMSVYNQSRYGPQNNSFTHHVTICVDRQRIISTTCTCEQSKWCQHVIATCLERLYRPDRVQFKNMIWDSLTELKLKQVQKLAQYFINELPRRYLPVAQKLIDELKNNDSEINKTAGAPDPTDGGHGDFPIWKFSIDEAHKTISQILIKFVKPSPTVHCDVNMLISEPPPPVANEYMIRIAVLRSHHPQPLWNGFSLISEMFKRGDENATMLLHVITTHCLSVDQIIIWWYQAKLLESGQWHMQLTPSKNSRIGQQNNFIKLLYHAAELCDEIVRLWKIAALNPKITDFEREKLRWLLQLYHTTAVSRVWKALNKPESRSQIKMMTNSKGQNLNPKTAKFTKEFFPGFSAALEACQVDYKCAELRGIPLSITRCSPPPERNHDCPNIPLLKISQNEFCSEMKLTIHQVTTAVLFEDQIESSAEGIHSQRHKSKKKKKPRSNIVASQQISVHRNSNNSGSGSNGFSGGEDSANEDFDGASSTSRERYEIELDDVFAQMHAEREPNQIRLDVCEALQHHGYWAESIYMTLKLAAEVLRNRPNVLYDGDVYCNHLIECTSSLDDGASQGPGTPKKNKRPMFSGVLLVRQIDSCPQKMEVQIPSYEPLKASQLAVETMERALKIMKILLKEQKSAFEVNGKLVTEEEMHRLALELGTATLSLPRRPAATHQLEVYLNHLDTEIYELLKTIKLTSSNLSFLRLIAASFIKSCVNPITITMPPIMLTLFLLEAMTENSKIARNSDVPRTSVDSELSLRASLLCLEMKPAYVEEDLPMYFECYRKLKMQLAVSLLYEYKDNVYAMGLILDRLLDSGVHRIHEKHDSNAMFFFDKVPSDQKHFLAESKRPVFKSVNESIVETVLAENSLSEYYKGPGSAVNYEPPPPETSQISEDEIRERRASKVVNAHATEALAKFYSDLAQKVFHEAGGITPSPLFTNPPGNNGMNRSNHRNLYLAAFLIGFYTTGIYNMTVRNWTSRLQNGFNVGNVQTQALEIGVSALEFIRQNWSRHFTPIELAALADKASHRADQQVIKQGAFLALTAVKNAHFLSPSETISRIRQCKEAGPRFLEDACIAIENLTQEHVINPQVLYTVSRYWYELYLDDFPEKPSTAIMPPCKAANVNMSGYYPPQNHYMMQPVMYNQPPPQPPQYMNQNTFGLHPSHSAPNLHPQARFQLPNDYNYQQFLYNQYYPQGMYNNQVRNPHPQQQQQMMQQMKKPNCKRISRPPMAPTPLNLAPRRPLPAQLPYNQQQQPQNISPPHSATPYPPVSIGDPKKIRLLNAYRLGMMAMEMQRNYEVDDRKVLEESVTNITNNNDIDEIRNVCQILGQAYMVTFYEHVATCISSPLLLEAYANEGMKFARSMSQYAPTYIEQMPMPAPPTVMVIPPKQHAMPLMSTAASSPSPTTSGIAPKYMNYQYGNIFFDMSKTSDVISNQLTGRPDFCAELIRRTIEMVNVAIHCRLGYHRLNQSDAEELRNLIRKARSVFHLLPSGKGCYESFLRHWKGNKLSKKKVNDNDQTKIKEIFESFMEYEDRN